MVKILKLKVLEPYQIKLWFDDGHEKIVDFKPFLGDNEITGPLKNMEFFRQVNINDNGRGLYWPNSYDVCPDFLRHHVKEVNLETSN